MSKHRMGTIEVLVAAAVAIVFGFFAAVVLSDHMRSEHRIELSEAQTKAMFECWNNGWAANFTTDGRVTEVKCVAAY